MLIAISIKWHLNQRALIWYLYHLTPGRFLPKRGGHRWLLSRWHCLKHQKLQWISYKKQTNIFLLLHKYFTPHRNSFSWTVCSKEVAACQWVWAERKGIVTFGLKKTTTSGTLTEILKFHLLSTLGRVRYQVVVRSSGLNLASQSL